MIIHIILLLLHLILLLLLLFLSSKLTLAKPSPISEVKGWIWFTSESERRSVRRKMQESGEFDETQEQEQDQQQNQQQQQ